MRVKAGCIHLFESHPNVLGMAGLANLDKGKGEEK
jgi:hypothetical protein